jgi:hypothetical protein
MRRRRYKNRWLNEIGRNIIDDRLMTTKSSIDWWKWKNLLTIFHFKNSWKKSIKNQIKRDQITTAQKST